MLLTMNSDIMLLITENGGVTINVAIEAYYECCYGDINMNVAMETLL